MDPKQELDLRDWFRRRRETQPKETIIWWKLKAGNSFAILFDVEDREIDLSLEIGPRKGAVERLVIMRNDKFVLQGWFDGNESHGSGFGLIALDQLRLRLRQKNADVPTICREFLLNLLADARQNADSFMLRLGAIHQPAESLRCLPGGATGLGR